MELAIGGNVAQSKDRHPFALRLATLQTNGKTRQSTGLHHDHGIVATRCEIAQRSSRLALDIGLRCQESIHKERYGIGLDNQGLILNTLCEIGDPATSEPRGAVVTAAACNTTTVNTIATSVVIAPGPLIGAIRQNIGNECRKAAAVAYINLVRINKRHARYCREE